MSKLFHKHHCPICGKLTFGTPTEGGITWDICPDCDRRQVREQTLSDSHRGETKGQPSA